MSIHSDPRFKKGDLVKYKHTSYYGIGQVIEYLNFDFINLTHEYRVKFKNETRDLYEFAMDFADPPKCECGATKTYGKNTAKLHHAFYCPARLGDFE